jgi:hypothetical protein
MEASPVGEQGGDGLALALADFEGEEAGGFERGTRLGDEAAIDVEAVDAGEECGGRFVVTDLGVEGVAVGGGDVGWVGDDGVEGGIAGRERFEQVGGDESDAAGEVVADGVRGGNFERGGRDIDRRDAGIGQVVGECDGDGTGTGADVEDVERRCGIEFFLLHFGQDGFDEVFGFGARDENGRRDVQGEAVELLPSGDVLDRLAGEAASDQGVEGGLLGEREDAVGVGVQRRAGDSKGVEEEMEGVAVGFGAKAG